MFDKFEPFKSVQKQDFAFQPSRYETWMTGKMIDNGGVVSLISAKVIAQQGSQKVEVTFINPNLNSEIAAVNVFDEFVTANDRLQLITVPKETTTENVALMMFKMTIGATREKKDFARNEPYCCNLFLQNAVIAKITFSFSNPEKLIEFYL